MTKFSALGLKQELLLALQELGYSDPTPIQERAIPELLAGHDVIGQAQTGTGKTAAFGLPLLQYLDPSSEETQAIVLTPTRELCIQVTQALRAYAEHLEVEIVAVFGGAPISTQQSRLRRGAHVVVATVGRMMDLMSRRSLVLTSARYVVLDEADEMLDLGFIEEVEKILRMCPSGRHTALFSATIPAPIARLAEQYMYDPVTIKVTPSRPMSRSMRGPRPSGWSRCCGLRSPSRRSSSAARRSARRASTACSPTGACGSRRCTAT